MKDSNFWYYVIMAIVILHFIVGFVYLFYKLSPKKSDKKGEELNKKDTIREETEDN